MARTGSQPESSTFRKSTSIGHPLASVAYGARILFASELLILVLNKLELRIESRRARRSTTLISSGQLAKLDQAASLDSRSYRCAGYVAIIISYSLSASLCPGLAK